MTPRKTQPRPTGARSSDRPLAPTPAPPPDRRQALPAPRLTPQAAALGASGLALLWLAGLGLWHAAGIALAVTPE